MSMSDPLNHLGSIFISFRTSRDPLFPKPVTGHELFFCRFLQQSGSSIYLLFELPYRQPLHFLYTALNWFVTLAQSFLDKNIQEQMLVTDWTLFNQRQIWIQVKKCAESRINYNSWIVFKLSFKCFWYFPCVICASWTLKLTVS